MRAWTFWPVSNSRTSLVNFKTTFDSKFLLQAFSFKVPPTHFTTALSFQTPINPYEISTLTSSNSWQTTYVTSQFFAFVNFPHFVIQWKTIQVFPWICASWSAVLTNPQKSIFFFFVSIRSLFLELLVNKE